MELRSGLFLEEVLYRMKRYLAIDIGASSGRHIVGWKDNGELRTEEVYRFPNGVSETDGHLCWDTEALVSHVKTGIEKARERFEIESLSIDTWGVDYVLLKGDETVYPMYAYRDGRTEAVIPEVHRRMAFSELYRRTGIQFQPFNTVYQLYADKIAGRLEGVTDFLMIPEYLLYRLCGAKSHEYTNATTGGMVSTKTGEYDPAIIEAMDLPRHLFRKLQQPGTVIGSYEGIKAVLCATHDTGSAVEGIPMEGNHPYISSGTWSLLGVKTEKPINDEASRAANWSNEGGAWDTIGIRRTGITVQDMADIPNLPPEKLALLHEMYRSIREVHEDYDLYVYICNMENASNNTTLRLNWNVTFGLGDDAPWFAAEVPTLMISTAYPYHLFDAPMIKTYINAYAGTPDFRDAVMEKLMGRSAFYGVSPIDPFCGREDTKW